MDFDLLDEGTKFAVEKLSKRELFAIKMFQAFMANAKYWDGYSGQWGVMAREAISAADALLEELRDG